MADLFARILEASFHGGVVILVILGLRLVLRNAPRNAICLLWLLAAVRLVCPVTVESSLSLQPDFRSSIRTENTLTQENLNQFPGTEETPVDAVGNTEGWDEDVVISTADGVVTSSAPVTEEPKAEHDWYSAAPWVWLTGVGILALYAIISYVNLRRRVRDSIRLEGEIYLRPGLDSAFVLGFVKPRIYLPDGLVGDALPYVIAHERAHIARKDHIWKLLGFAVLTIHWFNPLVWAAYSLLCRDLELACDEKVVRDMSIDQRKAYSMALVSCAARHSHLGASPVAFGEVDVKGRVKAVLNYKKPGFWVVLIAVIAIIAVAVFFLTSPPADSGEAETVGYELSADEKYLLEICIDSMERLRENSCFYLVTTEQIEGDPRSEDVTYTFLQNEDTWMQYKEYNMAAGREDYTVGNLMMDGVQYRFVHAGFYGEERNWTVAEKGQKSSQPWLLDSNILTENVIKVTSKYTADSVQIMLYFDGAPRDTSVNTYYGYEQTWYLDLDWNLQKVSTYCMLFTENGEDYYSHSTSELVIMEADEAEITAFLNDIKAEVSKVTAGNDQETDDLKLEQEEEARRIVEEEEQRNITQTTEHPHDEHQDGHY